MTDQTYFYKRLVCSLTAIIISGLVFLVGCGGSYQKSCWDDVCRIIENGVTRYEGDPEKIRVIQEREQAMMARLMAREQASQARKEQINQLPKRKYGDTIRVGVIYPEAEPAFEKYQSHFYRWIFDELSKDKTIKVVPHNQIKRALSSVYTTVPVNKGWNEDGPREKQAFVPNQETYEKLAAMGIEVDVLLYTSISAKTQSGLVGGRGQGVGVISASRIEISGLAASIYQYQAHHHAEVGQSAGKIDIAGRDKDGNIKSASLQNSERNIALDQPAAEAYARYFASIIKAQIAPHLPDLQALNALNQAQP